MSSGPKVKVLYTCKNCGIVDREVPIREREKDEDVIGWMRTVQKELGEDHMRCSSWCQSRLCDIKIPLVGKENCRIGEAPRQ